MSDADPSTLHVPRKTLKNDKKSHTTYVKSQKVEKHIRGGFIKTLKTYVGILV